MEESVNEEVLKKVDELVLLIKGSPEYKRYLEITKSMKENQEIMSLIKEIKDTQKRIVNLEYKNESIEKEDKIISSCLDELKDYPIYNEYSYLQEDFNSLFQGIKSILENYINDKIN